MINELTIFFSILKGKGMTSRYIGLYDISQDYNLGYRKARLIETKKRLLSDINKNASICMKYIPETESANDAILIMGTKGKKIYYVATERLGDHDSLDGEAYRICKPQKKRFLTKKGKYNIVCDLAKTYFQAVKIVPLTIEEAQNKNDSRYRTWQEIKMLQQATELVIAGVSQNLPIYYTHAICNDSSKRDYDNRNIINYFENGEYVDQLDLLIKEINKIRKALHGIKYYRDLKVNLNELYKKHLKEFSENIEIGKSQKYSNKSVVIFNEISSYDFNHLMESDPIFILRKEFILPTIFQILHGLAALNKNYGIVHFDLHLSNVLVTKIDIIEKKYWHYRVNKVDYYIPNQGYIFKIWDFGRANYLEYDNRNDIKHKLIRQLQRFFTFDEDEYIKKLDKTFNKASFRKYLYAFDVYRFFSAYYEKLIESIDELNTSKNTHLSTGSSSKVAELGKLKEIINLAFKDIMFNMVKPRLRNHVYRGAPINLILEFFDDYTSLPTDPEKNVINYGHPYSLQ